MTVPLTVLSTTGGQGGSTAGDGEETSGVGEDGGRGWSSTAPFVHATSELANTTSTITTTRLVDGLAERVITSEASRGSRGLGA